MFVCNLCCAFETVRSTVWEHMMHVLVVFILISSLTLFYGFSEATTLQLAHLMGLYFDFFTPILEKNNS